MTKDEALAIIRRSDKRRKGQFAGSRTATEGLSTAQLVAKAQHLLATRGKGKRRSKKGKR